MSKVIAAISTPVSPSGLGVIRVSGEQAPTVCERVFAPLNAEKPWIMLKSE